VTGALARAATAGAWLVAVIAIGLGGAGLVAAVDPGTTRIALAELEFGADALVTPRLDAAEASIAGLGDDVDSLGTLARGALAAMVAGQPDTVDATLAEGDAVLARMAAQTAAITTDLAAVPYAGTPSADLHLSPPIQARHARLLGAMSSTTGLADAWQGLAIGAAAAGRLAAQMADHDRLVGEAAAQGRDAKYKTAIATLKDATALLDASRAARDRLAATVDVTVLDEWLSRNEVYDAALTALYELSPFPAKVTKAIKDAIAAEAAARERLPPDSRSFTLIMAEIGQGGLNSAVIAIEDAKAALATALAPEPEPSPS
jgi:hypothetical protein